MSLKIVFFGTPDFAVPTLTALLNHSEMQVTAVVTQPDRRRGRGAQLIPSPVKQAAAEAQIPVWQPPRLRKCSETLTQLAETQADAFVVVAYGQLLLTSTAPFYPTIAALRRFSGVCVAATGKPGLPPC
jgi:methionyl-tRNA formyltransferase